ncbi:MAG TPA: anthranilate phosphoribosyltransferase [Acidimicrobiia bacterium]|nr:anthranilate phosphoribosyltransferase [Acidimicrobiia bacterium]
MKEIVSKLLDGEVLTDPEAGELVAYLTNPDLDPVLAATALAALRTRGETASEVRVFASALQDLAIQPAIEDVSNAVDVVGTGGDSSGSHNLSTGAALLAAAAGAEIVKHGNRSVSSRSGSFDVLTALGLDVPWDASRAGQVFDSTGFTYLFAPSYHPAMKSVAPVRQGMGARTIFNVVGPLANPARAPHLVVGAFSPEMARMMAETLSGMDIKRAFVVHGEPGWDEPTPAGPYLLLEVTPGEVVERSEDPADFGIPRSEPSHLVGGDPAENADAIRRVFQGETGPLRDAFVLGASLALRVTGSPVEDALARVNSALDDGSAGRLLDDLGAMAGQESVGV